MLKNYRKLLAGVLALGLSVGCASNKEKDNSSFGQVSSEKAGEMNAMHSSFDTAKEPEINANTRFAAGQLAETSGKTELAIEQYVEALKLDKDHQPSMFRLGVLYAHNKQYTQAIEMWQKYLKASDNAPVAYGNLGYCYEIAGKPAEAEAAYKKGIAKDAKNPSCRINYGLMLARHGRMNEAMMQLQSVLSPAEVHYNLASVFEQQNRKDQAKSEYKKALQLDPNFQDARTRLAGLE